MRNKSGIYGLFSAIIATAVFISGCGGGGGGGVPAPPVAVSTPATSTTETRVQFEAYKCSITPGVEFGVMDIDDGVIGQTVSVPIYLTGVEVSSATATVTYDPSKIAPDPGSFATSTSDTIKVKANPSTGQIAFYSLDYIPIAVTPDSGTFMKLLFHVVAPGTTTVSLKDVAVMGKNGRAVSSCGNPPISVAKSGE